MLLSPAGARVVTRGLSCGRAITWLLSPAGARVVTVMQLADRLIEISLLSPAGARAVTLSRSNDFARRGNVAVPRRGASCYHGLRQHITLYVLLLSPAGARAVTSKFIVDFQSTALLSPAGARVVTCTMYPNAERVRLLSPAGARVVTAYQFLLGLYGAARCCPPQGRELLRQKCEKYNADFRHSYNLFVLSSVFLRIHS